ncbi:MAG: transposase zinc-binding domain-containing protein [Bacillota bacterium]|nr:transposase zinc-binding domain-containing protein [Bacillota bacterium]
MKIFLVLWLYLGTEYRRVHRLPLNQLKAMASIESCRTIKLGGHIYKCDCCGSIKLTYNSCRNRHCPKCQNLAKESWLQDRKRDLMSLRYFHVVFTIPEEINNIVLRNQKVVYTFLYPISHYSLKTVQSTSPLPPLLYQPQL